jgi:hypothetical protein
LRLEELTSGLGVFYALLCFAGNNIRNENTERGMKMEMFPM